MSQVSIAKRKEMVGTHAPLSEHLQVRHLELDFTVPAYLEKVDLAANTDDDLKALPGAATVPEVRRHQGVAMSFSS